MFFLDSLNGSCLIVNCLFHVSEIDCRFSDLKLKVFIVVPELVKVNVVNHAFDVTVIEENTRGIVLVLPLDAKVFDLP